MTPSPESLREAEKILSVNINTLGSFALIRSIAEASDRAYKRGAKEHKTADAYFERIKAKARAEQMEKDASIIENFCQTPMNLCGKCPACRYAKAIRSTAKEEK